MGNIKCSRNFNHLSCFECFYTLSSTNSTQAVAITNVYTGLHNELEV